MSILFLSIFIKLFVESYVKTHERYDLLLNFVSVLYRWKKKDIKRKYMSVRHKETDNGMNHP